MRRVGLDEIESLAIGAWILGAGGGGSPYLGLLDMRQLYRRGAGCRLMDAAELADDDLVAVVSNMGALTEPPFSAPPAAPFLLAASRVLRARRPSSVRFSRRASSVYFWPSMKRRCRPDTRAYSLLLT